VTARLVHSEEVGKHPIEVKGAEQAVAWIDPTRIAQVFRNLLLNAVASSENGRPIEIAIEDASKNVVVKVEDCGSGIAPEDLPHLFEPFFTKRSGGTGLGLAVSHGIVLAHGGSIEIQSTQGKGTTVTVSLPKEHSERS
jgi:two-component system sensor histidine kinase BaeS